MRSVLRALLVIAAAAVIGITVNALRGQDRIDLSRQYFRTPAPGGTGGGAGAGPDKPPGTVPEGNGGSADPPVGLDPPSGDRPGEGDAVGSEFHPVDVAAARKLHAQARELPGFVIFLDARPADEYLAGHIPGAYQLDYYNITNLSHEVLDAVLQAVEVAHEVVVYCNGGDCEDSLLLCGELHDSYFVPADKLRLFTGGMEAWREAEQQVEEGERIDPGDDG